MSSPGPHEPQVTRFRVLGTLGGEAPRTRLSVVARQSDELSRLRDEHLSVMARRVTEARAAGEAWGLRTGRLQGVLVGLTFWAACFWALSWWVG